MKSIYDVYNMLTESFQSKYIRMFAQDASLISTSFSEFCKLVDLYLIAWDKITDDDIMKIDVTDTNRPDISRMYRALKAKKNSFYATELKKRIDFTSNLCIVLGYQNDKLYCVYNNYSDHFYTINSKRVDLEKGSNCVYYLEHCDVLYVILIDKYDTRKLYDTRSRAQYGMVPDLDKKDRDVTRHTGVLGQDPGGVTGHEGGAFTIYCRRLASSARERWKKIIAENKFKRTSDTKEVDELVEKTIKTYYTFMQDIMKAATTNTNIEKFKISSITKLVNGEVKTTKQSDYGWLQNSLLDTYSKYCEANVDLSQGDTYYAVSNLETRDKCAKAIKAISEKVDKTINELREKWGL